MQHIEGQSQPETSADASGFGINAGIVEAMREQYELNPHSVSNDWARYFAEAAGEDPIPDPKPTRLSTPVLDDPPQRTPQIPETPKSPTYTGTLHTRDILDDAEARKHASVLRLIHSFRSRGHRVAQTDPLGARVAYFPDVDPARYGFTDADLDDDFIAGDLPGGPIQTLDEILSLLRDTYCRFIGVEFTHIQDSDRKDWLIEKMESTRNTTEFTKEERLAILGKLSEAELFEEFVHRRFIGQKRFSLEGAESMIPLLDAMVEDSPHYGIRELVFGMAHRGRLNVLSNIVGKSKASIFSEFEDTPDLDSPFGSGDVKYHKGYTSDRLTKSGAKVHLSLTSNPSHLEAVNPVVEGRTRAKQIKAGDLYGHTILPVLLHGDAAFAGQGIVAETLNLSQLRGYTTGGTVHIIIDNQIGFTTTPAEARSTLYATDVAKMIQVPIFHVNGDEPESVLHVVKLAMGYRQRFHSDVVINLVCYRRHGHNEGDEPNFTQPLLYSKIEEMIPVRKLYTESLMNLGILTTEDAQRMENEFHEALEHELESIKSRTPAPDEPYEPRGPWAGYSRTTPDERVDTATSKEVLVDLAARTAHVPDDFDIHPKLRRMLDNRRKAVEQDQHLDWAFGELMAYATLLEKGFSVRISGQDCSRGTFSHRHAVFVDQNSGEEYAPLAHLSAHQGRFEVYDSLLSEAAVLGYEYGYSLAEPRTLTIWEAQFGDFANGAQVIIDQFIASAHTKWQRMSGLVMFLPHGYEGMGPEHSSARIERFLQLCAEENLQIVNCTTPAQIFHVLRRQMMRKFRAPLIVFTPKSLLRSPRAISPLSDFTTGRFQRVIDDPVACKKPQSVERVISCSGKVFYDLGTGAEQLAPEVREKVAIVRVEQTYPWPGEEIEAILAAYPNAVEFLWTQEEPENSGCWSFLRHRFDELLEGRGSISYVGRAAAASPAVGSGRLHKRQQDDLVHRSFSGLDVSASGTVRIKAKA